MTPALIVGFHSTGESIGALRWSIDRCKAENLDLVVVHASHTPIAVDNGPSAAIAHQLGNPVWATVHSIVNGLDAPPSTQVVVRSGDAVDVIAAHAQRAELVVLGPRRRRLLRRFDTQYRLQRLLECPVIRIDGVDPPTTPIELAADPPILAAA